jgi:glycosyltransferase involved in cell wall biosynthesis
MPDEHSVSATVLTKNSEAKIIKCLESLRSFPDVILLDSGSTDSTLEIASRFPNVRIHRSDFIGFGALKNLAASHASNDWILSIDSDEVLSSELAQNVLTHTLNPDQIGTIHRRNHYRGRLIDGCGWQNDISKRLYDRKQVRFSDSLVHESLIGSGELVRIKGNLNHFPFESASQLLDKAQFYSSLYAAENRFKKHSSVTKAFVKSVTTFIRDYIFKSGFFYGQDGLLIAASNANGSFYKYAKLYEANRDVRVTLVITTYNREDALEMVLKSVLEQSELPVEVIVADDGSDDTTKGLVETYRHLISVPLIHCWQPDEGFRLAEIRNRAIAMASGEYIVVLDGDMVLHKDFIRGHKRAAWSGRFVQGSRVWLSEEDADALIKAGDVHSIPSIMKLGNGIQSLNSPLLSRLFSRQVSSLEGIKGCNMAFWKADCIKVNGFNEDFRSWGREDSEFVARLMNSGVKRFNLRCAGIAYHLSHGEAARNDISTNDMLLERAISEKLDYCENGLAKSQSSTGALRIEQ